MESPVPSRSNKKFTNLATYHASILRQHCTLVKFAGKPAIQCITYEALPSNIQLN